MRRLRERRGSAGQSHCKASAENIRLARLPGVTMTRRCSQEGNLVSASPVIAGTLASTTRASLLQEIDHLREIASWATSASVFSERNH